jgi:hypothetical protein
MAKSIRMLRAGQLDPLLAALRSAEETVGEIVDSVERSEYPPTLEDIGALATFVESARTVLADLEGHVESVAHMRDDAIRAMSA